MPSSSPIRVLVVDDYQAWRQFVYSTLQRDPEFEVIGEVSDGPEAVEKAQELQPDLILLDIGMPTLNGIEAARRIREHTPESKILFVSENRSPDIVEAVLNTGARGYVVKSDAASELRAAAEAVVRGKLFVSSSLMGRDSINPEHEHITEQARLERVVAPLQPQNIENNRHELRLYSDDGAFVDDFAHSIEAALESGNAFVVIATEPHRAHLAQRLRADGVDVDAAVERKLYISLDGPRSLSAAMDTSTGEGRGAKKVPHAIVEAVQLAKERHLHLAVG